MEDPCTLIIQEFFKKQREKNWGNPISQLFRDWDSGIGSL